jgi:hypothetical protein
MNAWSLWNSAYEDQLGVLVHNSISLTPDGGNATNSGCWEQTSSDSAQGPGRCPGAVSTADTNPSIAEANSVGSSNDTLPPTPKQVVINEFAIADIYATNDNFVELYNRSSTSADLTELELHLSDDSSIVKTIDLSSVNGGTLAPGQYLLISQSDGTLPGDLTFVDDLKDGVFGFGVYHNPTGAYVDQVGTSAANGTGGALLGEGTRLGRAKRVGAIQQSYVRLVGLSGAGNCVDTNNNARDFTKTFSAGHASPQSTTDPFEHCGLESIASAATTVVISEFREKGPAGNEDEFVELFNPTSGPIDLTNYVVKENNDELYTFPSVMLEPGEHYLLGGENYPGAADAFYTLDFSKAKNLELLDAAGNLLDVVVHDGDPTTTLPELLDAASYQRRNAGCLFTGSMVKDFYWQTVPSPTLSGAPFAPC